MDAQAQLIAALIAGLTTMGGTIGLVVKALLARDERQSERENVRNERVMTTLETTIAGNHAAMELNRNAMQGMITSQSETLTLVRESRSLDRQEHQAIVDAQFQAAEKVMAAADKMERVVTDALARMEKAVQDALGKMSRREP